MISNVITHLDIFVKGFLLKETARGIVFIVSKKKIMQASGFDRDKLSIAPLKLHTIKS